MSGFPLKTLEPELLIIPSESGDICFYIKSESQITNFWTIPNLSKDDHEELIFDAIQILISKWSDKSLFNTHSVDYLADVLLMFSPLVFYVFQQKNRQ